MQNLYNVDTTGKAYTLDIAPLIDVGRRMTDVQTSGMQAVTKATQEGFKFIENFQARKQLANLSSGMQGLTPGSKEFEQQLTALIFQNPLAFNNSVTSGAAKAGLSMLADAHKEGLRHTDRLEEIDARNKFYTERDKVGLENSKALAQFHTDEDLRKWKQTHPDFDVEAFKASLDGGAPPAAAPVEMSGPPESAAPSNVPEQTGPPDPNATTADTAGSDNGAGALADLGPPPGGLDASLFPTGDQGVKGPPGIPGAPSIDIQTKAKAPLDKSPVVEQEAELKRKMTMIENQADALDRGGNPNAAAQVRALGADYQKRMDTLRGSEEYQQAITDRQVGAQTRMSAAEAKAKAPEVAASLSETFKDMPPSWLEKMNGEISGAGTATTLNRLQEKWNDQMKMAERMTQAGLALPENPDDFRKVYNARMAFETAREEALKVEKTVALDKLEAYEAAEPMPKSDHSAKAINFNLAREEALRKLPEARGQIKAAQDRLERTGKAMHETNVKAGVEKDTPKEEAAAPVEQSEPPKSAYEKALDKASKTEDKVPVGPEWSLNLAKGKLATDYPEVIDALGKVAKEKPTLEKKAVMEALAPFLNKNAEKSKGTIYYQGPKIDEQFAEYFHGADPYEVAKSIIADIRAKANPVPASGKTGGSNAFKIEVIK